MSAEKSTVMFCENCSNNRKSTDDPTKGYLEIFNLNNIDNCPYCESEIIDTGVSKPDFITLVHVSNNNRQLLDAMVDLHNKDIIEYELKMSQFRNQYEQEQQAQKQESSSNSSRPKCPTCSSTNITRISATSRVINAGMFGLLGNKRKKTFHCNNCKYEW